MLLFSAAATLPTLLRITLADHLPDGMALHWDDVTWATWAWIAHSWALFLFRFLIRLNVIPPTEDNPARVVLWCFRPAPRCVVEWWVLMHAYLPDILIGIMGSFAMAYGAPRTWEGYISRGYSMSSAWLSGMAVEYLALLTGAYRWRRPWCLRHREFSVRTWYLVPGLVSVGCCHAVT
jgi:hypothetical protein